MQTVTFSCGKYIRLFNSGFIAIAGSFWSDLLYVSCYIFLCRCWCTYIRHLHMFCNAYVNCTLHFIMVYVRYTIICDAVHYVTFTFWKLYVLELLHCVQLRFVTLRHVTFTLCCFRYVATSMLGFMVLTRGLIRVLNTGACHNRRTWLFQAQRPAEIKIRC